jgi:hypothetical protein
MTMLGPITSLALDLQRTKGETLVIGPMPSQYPPMTSCMAKGHRETHHLLTGTTPRLASTIPTKLLPAIRPTCHHQSITHSKYLREELSYVAAKATKDEAVTLATETSRHGERLVGMADPSKGNKIVMMMACDAVARKVRIADPADTMTKGKAPAAMTRRTTKI